MPAKVQEQKQTQKNVTATGDINFHKGVRFHFTFQFQVSVKRFRFLSWPGFSFKLSVKLIRLCSPRALRAHLTNSTRKYFGSFQFCICVLVSALNPANEYTRIVSTMFAHVYL